MHIRRAVNHGAPKSDVELTKKKKLGVLQDPAKLFVHPDGTRCVNQLYTNRTPTGYTNTQIYYTPHDS